MIVESQDTTTLKPADLDEFAELLKENGIEVPDQMLDRHPETFPLIVFARTERLEGFMFASLERIGGTPCILWALGTVRKGREAAKTLKALIGELYRRAAISFPDEDVLVGTVASDSSAYALFNKLDDVTPRLNYKPTGEERAWGRRLAKRYLVDSGYDDREFQTADKQPIPVFHTGTVKAGGKKAEEALGPQDAKAGKARVVSGWVMAEVLSNGHESLLG